MREALHVAGTCKRSAPANGIRFCEFLLGCSLPRSVEVRSALA